MRQFDPYGAATRTDSGGSNGGTVENPYMFSGGVQDRATGQVKFGQRWYDPTTGSWTQQDVLNAPLDPANANRYAYAADNPINRADPTGRDAAQTLKGLAGGITIESGGEITAFAAGVATEVGLGAGLLTGGVGFS